MNYIELSIYTSTQGAEIIGGVLSRFGIEQYSVQDPNDLLQLIKSKPDYIVDEKLLNAKGEVCVKAYLDEGQSGEIIEGIKAQLDKLKGEPDLDLGSLRVQLGISREQEWANNWKQYYKPFNIGKRFVVRPYWEQYSEGGQRIMLTLNPGMLFGTGLHESTKLCIAALEQSVKKGDKMLDIGCGSGILCIAALLLGAANATAVDIDENALPVVRENAELNGICQGRLKVYIGDILTDKELLEKISSKYDIIAANIVADVIIRLLGSIPSLIKPGGRFIAGGIIKEKADMVKSSIAQSGLTVIGTTEMNGWCCVTATL